MYCRKCGANNSDEAQFCRACGEPLKEMKRREDAATRKILNKRIIIVLGIIGIILIGGTVVVNVTNYWRVKKEDPYVLVRREMDNGDSAYFEYDENGNMIKATWRYWSGKHFRTTQYKYDENENLIEETYFDSNGSSSGICKYVYDNDNNRIKTRYWYYNGSSEVDSRDEYEYDENGNVSEIKTYIGEEVFQWNEYEYDEQGNVTRDDFYYTEEGLWCSFRYEYEYDEQGNINKEIIYDDDSGEITQINTCYYLLLSDYLKDKEM